MAESKLSPAVWDALIRLAYQDSDRIAVLGHLAHARDRAAGDTLLVASLARLSAAEQAARDASAARRAQENQLEDLNQRLKRTEERLSSGKLSGEREIAAAQTETLRLRAAIDETETEWLTASGLEDARQSALPGFRTAHQQEERAAAQRQEAAAKEVIATEARLAEIDRIRRDAAQAIPADVRDRYRALYQRTGGHPFALVSAGECSNCKRSVPGSAVQLLRSRAGVPNCPSCGRLLLQA